MIFEAKASQGVHGLAAIFGFTNDHQVSVFAFGA